MTLWISIHLPSDDSQHRQKDLETIAMIMLQYTPELALFDSSSLVLDVGASLTLFKGPRKLYRRIQASLTLTGMRARISMAPTATGAWLMARQKQTEQRRTLSMRSLKRHLDALHVSSLPAARPYVNWLNSIGCTTLMDLARLPRSGLNQRTSPQVLQALDAVYGKTTLHLNWYLPPDTFHASCALEFHTTHAHALLHAAQGLIEQLCGWLQARHHMASALQFSLHYEKGRHACPPGCITLRLSAPSRYAEDFLLLLKEQLHHERLHAPVIALDLHNIQSLPQDDPSGDLFPDRSQYQQQENQLLDLISVRLGQTNILQPRPIASHIPEYANRWTTIDLPDKASTRTRDGQVNQYARHPGHMETDTKHCHPFWMFEHPVKLTTKNDRPYYLGQALHLLQGPERIESGWWMDGRHEQRDYFIATDNRHCRYWIYRQRGSDNPHWFLHGLFA